MNENAKMSSSYSAVFFVSFYNCFSATGCSKVCELSIEFFLSFLIQMALFCENNNSCVYH